MGLSHGDWGCKMVVPGTTARVNATYVSTPATAPNPPSPNDATGDHKSGKGLGAVLAGTIIGTIGVLGGPSTYLELRDERSTLRAASHALEADKPLEVGTNMSADDAKSAVQARYGGAHLGVGGPGIETAQFVGSDIVGGIALSAKATVMDAKATLGNQAGVVIKAGDWLVPMTATGLDHEFYASAMTLKNVFPINSDIAAFVGSEQRAVGFNVTPVWRYVDRYDDTVDARTSRELNKIRVKASAEAVAAFKTPARVLTAMGVVGAGLIGVGSKWWSDAATHRVTKQ